LGYVPGLIHAWYVIAREAERRDGYTDIEQNPGRGSGGYQPIPQTDRTYQQTRGVVQSAETEHMYAEVGAGTSSRGAGTDQPPSYAAIVQGG
jgi:hypothetical protein